MREWCWLSLQPKVVIRATKFAVVVGAILIAINYGDVLLNGVITPRMAVKMALTVVVPYLVSTLSSVAAMMEAKADEPREERMVHEAK